MASVLTFVSSLATLLLVVPLVAAVGLLVLMVVTGQLLFTRPSVSRQSFGCPFSRRRATVEFLSPPGSERPSDVLSCSVFADPHRVRCKKGCLALAETRWAGSPMMPRFALIAGGVAPRPEPAPSGPAPVRRAA